MLHAPQCIVMDGEAELKVIEENERRQRRGRQHRRGGEGGRHGYVLTLILLWHHRPNICSDAIKAVNADMRMFSAGNARVSVLAIGDHFIVPTNSPNHDGKLSQGLMLEDSMHPSKYACFFLYICCNCRSRITSAQSSSTDVYVLCGVPEEQDDHYVKPDIICLLDESIMTPFWY
jgi:hypothetical protein